MQGLGDGGLQMHLYVARNALVELGTLKCYNFPGERELWMLVGSKTLMGVMFERVTLSPNSQVLVVLMPTILEFSNTGVHSSKRAPPAKVCSTEQFVWSSPKIQPCLHVLQLCHFGSNQKKVITMVVCHRNRKKQKVSNAWNIYFYAANARTPTPLNARILGKSWDGAMFLKPKHHGSAA